MFVEPTAADTRFKPTLAGRGFRARVVGFGVLEDHGSALRVVYFCQTWPGVLCWHNPRWTSAGSRRLVVSLNNT